MTFLDDVLEIKRNEVKALRHMPPGPAHQPRPGFREALAGDGLSVIAEIKRKSPSKGLLAPTLDARRTALAYAEGGASAISCLTDQSFFGAHPGDLELARATALPVLRKDFIIHELQIDESAVLGASAILLIVRILPPARLEALLKHASAAGLDVLTEVHDEAEIEAAVTAGSSIIGVNNRDLATLIVDSGRALALRARIPEGVISVAESGVRTREDVRRVEDAGFDAVLIGETLARSEDPAVRLRELRGISNEARG